MKKTTLIIFTLLFVIASSAKAGIVFTSETVSKENKNYKRPETSIVILDPDTGAERVITRKDEKRITYEIHSNPVVSRDGSRIAYASYRIYFDENLKIWKDWNGQVCTIAYGKPLTMEAYLYGYAYYPSWQYYESMLSNNWNVFTYNLKTGKEKQLSFFKLNEVNPQFIGGGNTILYWLKSEKSVFILKTDGGKRGFKQVVLRDNEVISPDVSPNGREIAFQSYIDGNWELYTLRIAEKMADRIKTRLTRTSMVSEIAPKWSPGGKSLLYAANSAGARYYDLYVIDVKTKQTRRLTSGGGASDEAEWSPDGSKIVLTSYASNTGPKIKIINTDGSGEKTITGEKQSARLPAWSPDGKRLAFISDMDGEPAVYITNADGTGTKRISKSRAAWQQPSWH